MTQGTAKKKPANRAAVVARTRRKLEALLATFTPSELRRFKADQRRRERAREASDRAWLAKEFAALTVEVPDK
jgi:hypothetical protein